MIPEWLIQLTWFAASVCATGVFWFFLSNKNYVATLWTGFATIVLSLAAVTLHIHNDIKRRAADAPESALPETAVIESVPSTAPIDAANPAAADHDDAAIATADSKYSPMTMEEYFDGWYHKATTSLQRDDLEARMLNRRIIWSGQIETIETGHNGNIRVIVHPIDGSYGTAFLDFDKSQRPELVQLQKDARIRFTARIRSFVASPFLSECKILRVLK
jgi:hypothetical protein